MRQHVQCPASNSLATQYSRASKGFVRSSGGWQRKPRPSSLYSETALVIEEQIHKVILRDRFLSLQILRFEPRSGDAAKNSARLPTRFVFRCHSSAPTTKAAGRPFRVMVCGPRDIARSITSLNFALASATVQACRSLFESPERS